MPFVIRPAIQHSLQEWFYKLGLIYGVICWLFYGGAFVLIDGFYAVLETVGLEIIADIFAIPLMVGGVVALLIGPLRWPYHAAIPVLALTVMAMILALKKGVTDDINNVLDVFIETPVIAISWCLWSSLKIRREPRIQPEVSMLNTKFRWNNWRKAGLYFALFYWFAFHGGSLATDYFGKTYTHAYGLEDFQSVPVPIEALIITLLIFLPLKWPQYMIFPAFMGAVLAHMVVRGSHWWEAYWQARALIDAPGPEHTFWIWSFYSNFFIYGPILAILITGWLSLRQIHFWISQRKIG